MVKTYKRLTDGEYNLLNDIARRTRMDCWFFLKHDSNGNDYVYDIEERKRMSLRSGVSELLDGVSCVDDCLYNEEKGIFKELLQKLNISI